MARIIEDMNSYILRLNLCGIFPFQAMNDRAEIKRFICVPEDIKFYIQVGFNQKFECSLSASDYLDVTDMNQIYPVSNYDFNSNYKRMSSKMDEFKKSLDELSFDFA